MVRKGEDNIESLLLDFLGVVSVQISSDQTAKGLNFSAVKGSGEPRKP